MTAPAVLGRSRGPVGHARPRISPPQPARTDFKDFSALAKQIGWDLRPWQATAARYLTALGPRDKWLYREVAIIVARQQGKTAILIPLIVHRLLAGRRIMHTAQNAKLPKEVHEAVAEILLEHFPESLPRRRAISYAVGHETIRMNGRGVYRIVAPTKGGARGPANDDLIVDELREMDDYAFIAAAKPTLAASPKPQMIYLSNAGSDASLVLNDIKSRAGADPSLAYLEWSAAPDLADDDVAGWAQANPSLGHDPAVMDTLINEYRTNKLIGQMAIFETEHLCRWVSVDGMPLVDVGAWNAARVDTLGIARGGFMGISMAPEGTIASAALAWRRKDGGIALTMLEHGTGSPVDAELFGARLRELAGQRHVLAAGFDPQTDAATARFLHKTKAISGREFANASQAFVQLVEGGHLAWANAEAVTADLTYTTRKEHDESGSFAAVRANEDVPITAVLAAVRAVWLATLSPTGGVRVY